MTNAEIIFNNSVFLMEQGVLKGVEGQTVKFKDENGEREVLVPEEIHTFNEWKKLGFMVQKGEHAVAKFPIWKKVVKKKEVDADDQDGQPDGKFFMKMAFFFTRDQVKEL